MKKIDKVALTMILATSALTSHAGVVVVGNPAATPLSQQQVADIYLGKSVASTPIDLPDGTPVREQFYVKATGRDAAQVKATWSRLAFAGKGRPPKVMADASGVKKAVAADPQVIGYIDSSAVDGTVKVLLTID